MSDNVVRLKRKVRPLRKTYDPAQPFVVERHDEEDGAISYEIWDNRQDTYRRLCSVYEPDCDDDEDLDPQDRGRAKSDADLIARALNFMNGYKPC
jgi:hypothetical protein